MTTSNAQVRPAGKVRSAVRTTVAKTRITFGLYSSKQLGYARGIVAAVHAYGLPERAAVIALETAMTESALLMYANGNNPESLRLPHDAVGWDHGSVGLFQQQVGGAYNSTANWGTTSQLMNPQISAEKFLNRLRSFDWQSYSNWGAAQHVQGSFDPSGGNYRLNDPRAAALASQLWATVKPPAPAPIRRRKKMFVYYVPNIPGGGANCFTFNGKTVRPVLRSTNLNSTLLALGQAKAEPIDYALHAEWVSKSD